MVTPPERRRDGYLPIRVSSAERLALEEEARRLGVSLGALLRERALAPIERKPAKSNDGRGCSS